MSKEQLLLQLELTILRWIMDNPGKEVTQLYNILNTISYAKESPDAIRRISE